MLQPDRKRFTPPLTGERMARMQALARWYFNPVYFGFENIRPERPSLYVGNHTIYGILDAPLYCVELYRRTGVYPRGLGDHYHFVAPVWREFLQAFGVVEGSPENCAKLMEAGDDVLVFPGGGREVCRRKNEAHCLVWKNRTGFARMAIEHGYPIVPVASLGADYAYSILVDGRDVLDSLPGRILTRLDSFRRMAREGEAIPPVARGLGLTPLPRPERIYAAFGKPIDTAPYKGMAHDPEVLWEVRGQTAQAINSMLESLKQYRAKDPGRGMVRRLLCRL